MWIWPSVHVGSRGVTWREAVTGAAGKMGGGHTESLNTVRRTVFNSTGNGDPRREGQVCVCRGRFWLVGWLVGGSILFSSKRDLDESGL